MDFYFSQNFQSVFVLFFFSYSPFFLWIYIFPHKFIWFNLVNFQNSVSFLCQLVSFKFSLSFIVKSFFSSTSSSLKKVCWPTHALSELSFRLFTVIHFKLYEHSSAHYWLKDSFFYAAYFFCLSFRFKNYVKSNMHKLKNCKTVVQC